jgi:uncharacterized protein YjbI with pentapeptide repeats
MTRVLQTAGALLLSAGLVTGLSAISAGAAASGLKYYACSNYGVVSQVSVSPHTCPTGTSIVKGKFKGTDFSGVDFTNANLGGANMSGAKLAGVNSAHITGIPAHLPKNWQLQSGYLIGPGANFSQANLSGMVFTRANLSGASFYHANLSNVDFGSSNLKKASLSSATLTGAKFAKASMVGVISAYENGQPASLPKYWRVIVGQFQGAPVEYLVGPGASIGGAQLGGANFAGMNLKHIYLAGAHLTSANFTGTNLTGANLASAGLGTANFTGANLTGASIKAADLSGANLTNAKFVKANLFGSRLLSVSGASSANFKGAKCPDGKSFGNPGADCNLGL